MFLTGSVVLFLAILSEHLWQLALKMVAVRTLSESRLGFLVAASPCLDCIGLSMEVEGHGKADIKIRHRLEHVRIILVYVVRILAQMCYVSQV